MDLHLSPDMWNIVDTANGHEPGGRAEHKRKVGTLCCVGLTVSG
jgi:hypothetical protein